MKVSAPKYLLTKSLSLSLSDQYWINPVKKPLEWEKINFFDNAFSEDVGNALFGKKHHKIDYMSPDITTNGQLMKKWDIIGGRRCLIKGGSNSIQQQPFSEAAASVIMKRLGINHIPYTLIFENDKPYSVCGNFVTSETDLITAWQIIHICKKSSNTSYYQHFLNCCSVLDVPDIQDSVNKMITADYLLVNEDRHYNNFGIIRDAETLKARGLAPVYDTGASLWYNTPTGSSFVCNKTRSMTFRKYHEEQIKFVKDFSWLELSALKDADEEIREIFSQFDFIEPIRRDKICRAFKQRINMLNRYVQAGQVKGKVS
jgi:hypothetical protein